MTDDPAASTPISFTTKDAASSTDPPIVCTLPSGEVAGRLDEWAAVLDGSTRTSIDGGLRIELGDRVDVADVARLAAAEQSCCRFFSFRLTIDARGNGFEVTAPADALDLVHAAFGPPD